MFGHTFYGESKRMAIVMELGDGGDLGKWLFKKNKDQQPGPERHESRKKLAIGIVSGVEYLHRKNIVHRDLKPGNIIICERTAGPIPKICDFGLAKVKIILHRIDYSGSGGLFLGG